MISIKLQSNVTIITLWHGCSLVILLHICRIPFNRNTSRWLLLKKDIHMEAPGKKKSPRKLPPEKYILEICPQKNCPHPSPPENYSPEKCPQGNCPPDNHTPKNCFTSFFLLLTLSYGCSF